MKQIKVITFRKEFPDKAMTKLANLLGEDFISCEKNENGLWVLHCLAEEKGCLY